jgi:hypothetical protein
LQLAHFQQPTFPNQVVWDTAQPPPTSSDSQLNAASPERTNTQTLLHAPQGPLRRGGLSLIQLDPPMAMLAAAHSFHPLATLRHLHIPPSCGSSSCATCMHICAHTRPLSALDDCRTHQPHQQTRPICGCKCPPLHSNRQGFTDAAPTWVCWQSKQRSDAQLSKIRPTIQAPPHEATRHCMSHCGRVAVHHTNSATHLHWPRTTKPHARRSQHSAMHCRLPVYVCQPKGTGGIGSTHTKRRQQGHVACSCCVEKPGDSAPQGKH